MTTPPTGDSHRPWPAWAAALVIAVFGFLPLANWIPAGRSVPWFGAAADDWVTGAAIALGGGLVLAILLRRWSPAWQAAVAARFPLTSRSPTRAAVALLVAAGLMLYLIIALQVFSGRPLIIDEVVQAFQARIFASGRLYLPTPLHPEFTQILNLVQDGPRTYGHFPPGGSAALALGELLGAQWIVGPLFGAASIALMAWLLPAAEPRPGVRVLALGVFAFAPFTAFMAGSHMSHVPALTFLLLGSAATLHTLTSDRPRPGTAFLSGVGFGAAASIRPLDAVAFAVPAAIWYLVRAGRDRSWVTAMLAAGLGVALPLSVLFAVQQVMTGSAFRFGYEVLWGSGVGLGFQGAPWGESHTPLKGLELLNLYFLRLQAYFLETPGPALLPALLSLALVRRLSAADRYLLASAGTLVALYFAYWHDGFFLGPRFFYPLLPVLALWTARLPALLEERFGRRRAYWTAMYGLLIAAIVALMVNIPIRTLQYRNAFATMRWDADRAARAAGVSGALVLVRESWGAQMIARLWALGVPHGETEHMYLKIDACVLENAIASYERQPSSARPAGREIGAALRTLLADSSRLVPSPFSPDTTELMLPGATYTPTCLRRIVEDRQGFTLLAPLILARGNDNVYVRDLHERNHLILEQYPDRPVYLLRPRSSRLAEEPTFMPVPRDSLEREWTSSDASGAP